MQFTSDNPIHPAASVSRGLSLVRWLAMSWAVMVLIGFITIYAPGSLAARNQVGVDRAIFTAISTATLTGFAQSFASPADFALVPRIVFGLQIFCGLLLSLIGGGVLIARAIGSRHSDSRIAFTGLILIVFSALIGVATIAPDESALSALTRGVGALAGAGTIISPVRAPSDPILHIALLPLSVIGGLGIIVVLDFWDLLIHRFPISPHAWRALAVMATIYVAGTLILFLLLADPRPRTGLLRSSALILSAAGFGATTETISQLPRGVDWVLIAASLAGIGTLGATGGVGLAWLFTLDHSMLKRAAAWIAAQGMLILLGLVLLLQFEEALTPERALMLVTGSVSNVGLSHAPVASTGTGPLILSALMLAGRLLPLLMIATLIHDQNRKD